MSIEFISEIITRVFRKDTQFSFEVDMTVPNRMMCRILMLFGGVSLWWWVLGLLVVEVSLAVELTCICVVS